MKFASWNVNGLRARLKDNFLEAFKELDADIFAVQDIKVQQKNLNEIQKKLSLGNYESFWNCSERKGCAGTAVFSRIKPAGAVRYGIGAEDFDIDGRTITLDLGEFYFVNVYIPHCDSLSWNETNTRAIWGDLLLEYIVRLDKVKPVVIAGSFMFADERIELAYPEITALLKSGFVDVFLRRNPTRTDACTWWSSKERREQNEGWRVDYFLTSERLLGKVSKRDKPTINDEIKSTSKNCPITLTLD